MSLAHAILAALLERAHSGYDLAKRFDGSAGFFWHASHQQIYRELSKLESAGHLTCRLIEQETRPNKKLYSITEIGRRALGEWVCKPSKIGHIKDELLIKVFAGHLVPKEALIREIKRHYHHYRHNLERYQAAILRYSHDAQTLSDLQKFHYATLRAGIHHETARVAWCEDVLRLLMT